MHRVPQAPPGSDEARMFHGFLRTLVKVVVASLILGTVMTHFGITSERLMAAFGVTPERLYELAQKGINWALPNLLLGALVIVPIWFVVYLLRPPSPGNG
jgi:uncharacterized protein DUF6460